MDIWNLFSNFANLRTSLFEFRSLQLNFRISLSKSLTFQGKFYFSELTLGIKKGVNKLGNRDHTTLVSVFSFIFSVEA